MRVLELSGQPDLPLEALGVDFTSELSRKDLEYDLPPQTHVFGDEHATHTAAEITLDAVVRAESGLQPVAEVSQ